jgi:hypothetical protein
MMSLRRWTAACAMLVLMFTLMSGMIVAQDAKVFEGTLMGFDPNTKVLTLKDGDKEMQFSYTDQTELVAPEKDGKPVVVQQGSRLKITYTENEKLLVATKIEVMEA